LSFRA